MSRSQGQISVTCVAAATDKHSSDGAAMNVILQSYTFTFIWGQKVKFPGRREFVLLSASPLV